MLNAFTNKNKIKYKEIFRISVNMTMNIGVERSSTHKDHEFPHKQLLIYLNDFEGGETVILNDNDTTWLASTVADTPYTQAMCPWMIGLTFKNYISEKLKGNVR